MVDDHKLFASYWAEDSEAVRSRASFDFHCPKDQLKLTIIATGERGYDELASQIGVRGCEREGASVRTPSGWVLNAQR